MSLGISLQALVDRAMSLASVNLNTDPQALSMVTEDVLINVFQDVGIALAASRDTRKLLRVSQNVIFANGSVTLPVGILTQYANEGTLQDATDSTTIVKRYSYEPEWAEFIRQWDQRIGYWTVQQYTIYVTEPNATYDPTTGLSETRLFTCPTIPQVPAVAGTIINYPDEVVTRLIIGTANAIVGQSQVKVAA